MRSDVQLAEIALQVLVAWNGGRKPDPGDTDILKKAFPPLANLEIDHLCCQILHDLGGRRESESDRTGQGSVDEVA